MEDQRKRKLSLLFLVRFSVFKTLFIVWKHERLYVCMTEGLLRVCCLCMCMQLDSYLNLIFICTIRINISVTYWSILASWFLALLYIVVEYRWLIPVGVRIPARSSITKADFFFRIFVPFFFLHLIQSLCIDHSVFFIYPLIYKVISVSFWMKS